MTTMHSLHPTTVPKSSMIDYISYDAEVQLLIIRFNNGKVYVYTGVPLNLWRDFTEAPSLGKFFLANIRDSFKTTAVL